MATKANEKSSDDASFSTIKLQSDTLFDSPQLSDDDTGYTLMSGSMQN